MVKSGAIGVGQKKKKKTLAKEKDQKYWQKNANKSTERIRKVYR